MRVTAVDLSDEEHRRFCELLERRSGIVLPSIRRSDLQQAVASSLMRCGASDPSALHDHLSSSEGHTELEAFISSLTIGETHFFRNTPQFEALEHHVFPALIRERSSEKRLRIWSAGCSSGEEPYSLAMLLDRILPDIERWNITILGTDIDREALERAARGRYRAWSFRGTSPAMQDRYFSAEDDDLQLSSRIREMVRFEYLNLVEDVYPSLLFNTHEMDLVVCRNVLIYFRDETARQVIQGLHRTMAEGAWLFLGHSEPSRWLTDRFNVHNFEGATAFRRKEDPELPQSGAPVQTGHARALGKAASLPDEQRRESPRRPRPGRTDRGVERRTTIKRKDPEVPVGAPLDTRGTLKELQAVAEQHPNDPRPAYLLAKSHAGRLESEEAERWIAAALMRDPLFAPAHYLSGLVATEDGRSDDAVDAFRRCVYAEPAWPLGHFVLAESLLRVGQSKRAAVALQNLETLLTDVSPGDEVPEGDGLTAGRLLELSQMQREIQGLDAGGDAAS